MPSPRLTLRRAGRLALFLLVVPGVLLTILRLLPATPLKTIATYSSAVYAADGSLLRLTTADDEQFRLWTPYTDISPHVPNTVLHYEDRWFWWHPGVNPAALVRSAAGTFAGGRRQGGSTITMQLARKVYGIDSRTVGGKALQIATALWLEARYAKQEILEAYLNIAPYGGNVEGIGAASLVYFHKRAADLTLPEALTLAVIPQNPAARGGAKVNSPTTQDARHRLATHWLRAHPSDERLGAALAVSAKSVSALPFRAPHLASQMLRTEPESPAAGREIFTTLDRRMQAVVEESITRQVMQRGTLGIRNAAALLVDAETMETKALAGSANFHDDGIDGQVNGVLAKRSPGSTLKPFIYALAFDQGTLHPMTVLKDAPTSFGPFSPENFDGRFVGPLTAQDALIRSRNVPAVAVAAKLTRPNLYDFIKSAGVSNLASEKHYGLALALGGGDVSMEELARLYAVLANGGELRPIEYQRLPSREPRQLTPRNRAGPVRLLSEEAAFVTLDMLSGNPRPDTQTPAQPRVAWKTGTSWGFRDAWTAGVFGRYVLVVWVGNFDSTSNPAFVGVSAAAPLFFDIVDSLKQQRLIEPWLERLPPRSLRRIDVCAATGDLPNAECPQRVATWFAPGRSPIRVSNLHRRVLIDRRTDEVACSENAFTTWEVREFWPTDLQKIFRDAGIPRRVPSQRSSCPDGTARPTPSLVEIASPTRGVVHTFRLSQPVALALRAEGRAGKQFWFVDEALVGEVAAGQTLSWLPPRAGRYTVRVVAEDGSADSREVIVEMIT